jgi:hypothetical protein
MQTLRRWSANEGITSSAGGRSFTLGGSYHTNRMSVSVNHGLQFLLNGRGYQSVTSVRSHRRAGRQRSSAGRSFGKTLWSSSGTFRPVCEYRSPHVFEAFARDRVFLALLKEYNEDLGTQSGSTAARPLFVSKRDVLVSNTRDAFVFGLSALGRDSFLKRVKSEKRHGN